MRLPDPDLSGKTAIVTGASSGVGFEVSRGLARRGCRVIMAQRNDQKAAAAREEITRKLPNARLAIQTIDLGDLASVEVGAAAILSNCPRIDFLINNAGLHDLAGGHTRNGFNKTIGVNYIGPFLLTDRLLPRLMDTAKEFGSARIVNVASMAHAFAFKFDPDDPFPDTYPREREVYSESKLANMLHARALARHFAKDRIAAYSVHPGFVASEFGRAEHWPGAWRLAFTMTKPIQISPARGAEPALYAALNEFHPDLNGAYFTAKGETRPKYRGDPDIMAETLWERTIKVLTEKGFAPRHA